MKKKYLHRLLFSSLLLAGFICSHGAANDSDTLRLNLPQADSIFLGKNLLLLASQYNIKAADAMVLQAKAYPNPVFSADVHAYDSETKEAFKVGPNGEKIFMLEQLILLGGKRKSQIDIAKLDKQAAEMEFSDLLRNLRLQLHSSFYSLQQQQIVLQKYNRQLALLETIIASYEVQFKKGNLPLKDVVRLKAVYLNINNDKSELAASNLEEMSKIQILLQGTGFVIPVMNENFYDSIEAKEYDTLIGLALNNRPDLKLASNDASIGALQVRLQKQNAVPDINVRTQYDQRGNAFNNQWLAGISVPLPIFSQNRGNIKAAKYNLKQTETLLEEKKREVNAEVNVALQNLLRSITEYRKTKQLNTEEFEEVYKGVNDNFLKGNIAMLEYVDFIESYNASIAEFQRVKTQLALASEQINFVTASQVY